MKNSLELIQLGKEVSEAFVRDGKPLTETLTKVAQVNGLNQEEINRVAETANVETYLKMIQKTEDKYLDFPLANSKEVYTNITKTANISSLNKETENYADLPNRGNREFSFDMYGIALEKTAETDNTTNLINEADRLNGTIEYIGNHLMEESVSLAKDYDNIFNLVKQAMLSETATLPEIEVFIKKANFQYGDNLINSLREDIISNISFVNLEKVASEEKEINKDSTLYKALVNYDSKLSYITKIAEAYAEYEKDFNRINDDNKLGICKKAFWGKAILGAAVAGTIATAGAVVGKNLGKPMATKLNRITALEAINNAKQLR